MKKLTLMIVFSLILLGLIGLVPIVIAGPHIGSGLDSGVSLGAVINPNQESMFVKCGSSVDYGLDPDNSYNRLGSYLFEGEKLIFETIAIVPKGIKKDNNELKTKAYMTLGNISTLGNDIIAECSPYVELGEIHDECNVFIDGEEIIEFNEDLMVYYSCVLTVGTESEVKGGKIVSAELWDYSKNTEIKIDDDESWSFNPTISIKIEGAENGIPFLNLKSGKTSYSDTVTITNTINQNLDIPLNIFLSGTDFKDEENKQAKCPDLNVLSLNRFSYYAINDKYNSMNDVRDKDTEGYLGIQPGVFGSGFYNRNELLQIEKFDRIYYKGSILEPSFQAYLTFKVNLPEPCFGTYDSGQIYIWAEAI